jgi:hypothetical protein
VGEYQSNEILITHAWQDLMAPNPRRSQFKEGPTRISFYIISCEVEDNIEEGVRFQVPNYHWIGDFFAVCLGIFFGKRFDHHGLTEAKGSFCLPSYHSASEISSYELPPFNSKPRIDLEMELKLDHLKKIAPILEQKCKNKRALEVLFTAGNFYLRALRFYDEQPEMAYLDLVTAGEILSNYYDYDDEVLLNEDFRNLLKEIQEKLEGGEKKANIIRSRLYQVRKKYKLTVRRLLNDNFFIKTQAKESFAALRKEDIEASLLASYDLRSRYIHTGERFGGKIRDWGHLVAERIVGEPVVDDKDYKKILMKAPTFLGLERIMRYCLLCFIHTELCPIDPQLD